MRKRTGSEKRERKERKKRGGERDRENGLEGTQIQTEI